jgi:hypothetical protein
MDDAACYAAKAMVTELSGDIAQPTLYTTS